MEMAFSKDMNVGNTDADEAHTSVLLSKLICIDDFKKAAESRLTPSVREYVNTGADNNITVDENNRAFSDYWLVPRVLRDVASRSLHTTLLGQKYDLPFGVDPSCCHGLVHAEAEIGTAVGAVSMGAPFILSTWSNTSLEDVANAVQGKAPKWLHMTSVYKPQSIALDVVKRAENYGYEAIVLCVDAPVRGRRRSKLRLPLKMPDHLRFPHIDHAKKLQGNTDGSAAKIGHDETFINPSCSWQDAIWLKNRTQLPVVLKGILSPDDAVLAVKHGFAGILVSNKGGRQLDTAIPTIHALPRIVRAVLAAESGGVPGLNAGSPATRRMEIYLDGGVRTGVDVLKALCLGADAVFVGRPALWGLACGGRAGVRRVLQLLREELDVALALVGCSNVAQLSPDLVVAKSAVLAKL